MFVTKVIGDCPGCGGTKCFGNVSVHETVLRGCTRCNYRSNIWLPEIRKKVIYLDQFFFSGALRGGDPRFTEAAHKVRELCHLQLLVSPYSSVHEDETRQWRGHGGMSSEQLMDFIKDTARGAEFVKDYAVEQAQVLKAWKSFLNGQSSQYACEDRDALQGSLDSWDDYFRIDVGGYTRDVELKRRLKKETVDILVKEFDRWQVSTQTFEQAVALEIHDAGKAYVNSYVAKIKRFAEGDIGAAIDSPMNSMMVEYMMHWLEDSRPIEDRLKRCIEYFKSSHFAQVPSIWLESHIYGTLREMVKLGAFSNRDDARQRLFGVFEDISHISLYAPYCDAIVIDNFMADLVGKPTVALGERYGVKVFSLNSWDALLAWLHSLEAQMSEEHRAAVAAAYP